MSWTWNPLHASLVTSSLLSQGTDATAVWALFISTADRMGESDLTVPCVAALFKISEDRAQAAFDILASPDPRSRNKKSEGRRIIQQPDGRWLLVTHEESRKRASKEAAAVRQRDWRDRNKGTKNEDPEPQEPNCDIPGCTSPAYATEDGKTLCSRHIFKDGEATQSER
jgi:hypothetical protein